MSMTLEEVLDDLRDAAEGHETTVGEVLDSFASRSLGVLLTLFGVLALIPIIGALPGVPVALGVLILAAIFQSVFAHGGIWAPQRLRDIAIPTEKVRKGVDSAKPWVRRVDNLMKQRLSWMIDNRTARIVAIFCASIMGFAFIPLSIIPMGIVPPALAVVALGLALLGKDGLVALFGYALSLGAIGAVVWIIL